MSEVSLLIECIQKHSDAVNRYSDEVRGLRESITPITNFNVLALANFQHAVLDALNSIASVVNSTKGEILVALTKAEDDLIKAFDVATTAVGKRIDDLIAAGVSDSPEFIAALQAEADKLKLLGSNGSVPETPGV